MDQIVIWVGVKLEDIFYSEKFCYAIYIPSLPNERELIDPMFRREQDFLGEELNEHWGYITGNDKRSCIYKHRESEINFKTAEEALSHAREEIRKVFGDKIELE